MFIGQANHVFRVADRAGEWFVDERRNSGCQKWSSAIQVGAATQGQHEHSVDLTNQFVGTRHEFDAHVLDLTLKAGNPLGSHVRTARPGEHNFGAVDERYIILRMLNNLKGIYLNTRQHRKALLTQEAILALSPASAEEVKLRGKLNFQLRRYGHARKDFETYLSLRPRAEDAAEIKQNIEAIAKILAMMN